MNIAQFLTSIDTFDLLVILVLFAMFILGFIQGTVRRLLGLASVVFSFFVAAQLRDPLGTFLASNWTQYAPQYSYMVGFGTAFLAGCLTFSLLIQTFYRKVPLFEKYTIADEVMGGSLGVVQGAVMLGAAIIILDSFFQVPGVVPRESEIPFLRDFYNAYDQSSTAILYRERIIPGFLAVTGPLMPDAIRAIFPGR